MAKPRILVSNDDGIHGRGLAPLLKALSRVGEVFCVVPHVGKSAFSHAITLHLPLRVVQVGKNLYTADGTPVDCVRFGVLGMLKQDVDLVVSGVNEGPNLADDVVYSGTVGGAREGAMLDVPAFAISLVISGRAGRNHFDMAAQVAARTAKAILRDGLPKGTYLNVNVPDVPAAKIRGIEVVRLGKRSYGNQLERRTDPRGMHYYWLAGDALAGEPVPGTDIGAIFRKRISVTPLIIDATAADSMSGIRAMLDPKTIIPR